jgi:hypothetical protein
LRCRNCQNGLPGGKAATLHVSDAFDGSSVDSDPWTRLNCFESAFSGCDAVALLCNGFATIRYLSIFTVNVFFSVYAGIFQNMHTFSCRIILCTPLFTISRGNEGSLTDASFSRLFSRKRKRRDAAFGYSSLSSLLSSHKSSLRHLLFFFATAAIPYLSIGFVMFQGDNRLLDLLCSNYVLTNFYGFNLR